MKTKHLSPILAALLIAAFVVIGNAQNRERFSISAKAGGVNAVSGHVMVRRAGQNAQQLTSQEDLASGDVVSTGLGSQTEILLNPGTYLRLAENSEFEMVDNSLDNLLVKVNKGSAIIEATGFDNIEMRIPIITEQQRMTIVRAGVYRINVRPGVTELYVRKVRMTLGNDRDALVKSGKKLTFTGTGQSIAKLEKTDKDQFDDWSKLRGQTLASANERLSARALNGYLKSSVWGMADARFGRWGLWTWSPYSSCYTFFPFYYGWGSPYGSNYGLFAGYGGGYYPYNPRNYNPNIVNNSPNSSASGSSSGSGGPTYSTVGGSSGSNGGSSGGSPMSAPASHPGSQAGPRDPDSGSRSINRIKDPE